MMIRDKRNKIIQIDDRLVLVIAIMFLFSGFTMIYIGSFAQHIGLTIAGTFFVLLGITGVMFK